LGIEEVHTGFWWGNLRERDHLEDLGINGRIIFKCISKLLIWLRWRARAGTSCLAEDLLVSEEELCSMEHLLNFAPSYFVLCYCSKNAVAQMRLMTSNGEGWTHNYSYS
jgi:hypothetical protein